MKDLSRRDQFPDPKLVDCGGCGLELLGEGMAGLGPVAQTIYGRPHVAGRVRDGERDKPLCRWCLNKERDFHEYGEPVG